MNYSIDTGKTYFGTTIYRYRTTGYYEAYVGGRFVKADTLAGIKALIKAYR